MAYTELRPINHLKPYVDSYWFLKTGTMSAHKRRILPDGCIDIIVNLGSDLVLQLDGSILKNDCVGFVGTMTKFKGTITPANSDLIGIRFKPLGFSYFFPGFPLKEFANKSVEFECEIVSALHKKHLSVNTRLDQFLLQKFESTKCDLQPVLTDINNRGGNVRISELTSRHYIAEKKLERDFGTYMGITPKEYLNFVRYQVAFRAIKKMPVDTNLEDIAVANGYYDHAHLSNAIKKYSGLTPCQIQ
jgi:AraC-like DNA-binding protein